MLVKAASELRLVLDEAEGDGDEQRFERADADFQIVHDRFSWGLFALPMERRPAGVGKSVAGGAFDLAFAVG
jgi:hypothetical protein